ncbi:cystathionine beta-lyase [Carbonactinospora thermoautotrophica]|uniref:Cytochrome bc1 complex cytochrome c subunit n=1 Tax=Carbonactinospora thermoautotrophica TaxID=1469144 RepID=A0A132MWE3_9ACTN|nr:c-type cytochrome [Carbonactinospora thermoautotrophica]KWX01682.1 putative menaquinol-cytochrome c reductase cytochrome c subunit [Carbonactinospora thermoautotrophica]MCX9190844.1 cystathionine beta-lyase [Carbonactinospora thermoautotrophica]
MAALGAVVLGLASTGAAYAALAPADKAEASTQASVAVEEGRKLYLQNCSTCHGLNAEGTSDGPSLIGVGAAAVDFQVGTGRMPMAAPGAQAPRKKPIFTQSQIDQLAAYIASLGPGPSVPAPEQYDPSKGDVAEGGELFRENCSSCHNFAGQGGALTRGKYAPPLTDVEPKHIYEAMQTGPQAMPVFNDQVMPPEKKRDIIAYLQNVKTEGTPGGLGLGQLGPVAEGLFIWTVGLGALVGVAVWIGAKTTKAPASKAAGPESTHE